MRSARLLDLNLGDAVLLRNAGARVTDDVLRILVLATQLLDVTRILVLGAHRLPHDDNHRRPASPCDPAHR